VLCAFIFSSYGCLVTKVVSVPLRITGAVISAVPVVGETIDDAIDTAADTIDDIPI
jgi:hypothetical protein|tara:strand:+ start:72 stop:239 length:168 start_codon:yes stop_codon:yes gene_type:complete